MPFRPASLAILQALLLVFSAPATAQDRAAAEPGAAVAYADRQAEARGDRSPIAVLGTPHLSGLAEDFDPRRLEPLLERLAAWRPDRIAIEGVPGDECDRLRQYADANPGRAKSYCVDPMPARWHLKLRPEQAAAEIETILEEPADSRPAEVRRRLAALFLAVGEPASALVQWLRLPEAQRIAGDELNDDLVAFLEARRTRRNENYLIAAVLAVRLGHERVYSVDYQGSIRWLDSVDEDAYPARIREIWDNEYGEKRVANHAEQRAALDAGGSILAWYRYYNSPEEQLLAVQNDFGAAAGDDAPGRAGRSYLAYWETRNLRMVANLREVAGNGNRVLAIVGASHKPYYERYLSVVSDVAVVDINALLAE